MRPFQETRKSNGYFWPSTDASNIWTGSLELNDFPEVELFSLSGKDFPDSTDAVHGVSTRGEYFSIFNVNSFSDDWYHAAALRTDSFDAPDGGKGYHVFGDYLIVGSSLYGTDASIRRISGCSIAAEKILGLKDSQHYSNFERSTSKRSFFARFLLLKKILCSYTYTDQPRRRYSFGIHAFQSLNNNRVSIVIDFVDLAKPQEALSALIDFRDFISFVCCENIDITDVRTVHFQNKNMSTAHFHFYTNKRRPFDRTDTYFSLIPLGRNAELFRHVLKGWSLENDSQRRARRLFLGVLADKGEVRFSHLRELVTIIEMLVSEKDRPLSKELFSLLRERLESTISSFHDKMSQEIGSEALSRMPEISNKIALLNHSVARKKVEDTIASFSDDMKQECFWDIGKFAKGVIALRDTLTHDMGRLTAEDYQDLIWYVTKLKAIYVCVEIERLGVTTPAHQLNEVIRSAISAGSKPPSMEKNISPSTLPSPPNL